MAKKGEKLSEKTKQKLRISALRRYEKNPFPEEIKIKLRQAKRKHNQSLLFISTML